MKIWIDAGHGGSASGAVGCGRMEKNDTLTGALEAAVAALQPVGQLGV